ncbi:hypothetical protein [Halomarina ordinaria]|uniref:Glycosyltransferase RgtA/B/C/D-like domain-containing protein n=1 Tax=Halomarina ordinaria TaxID=3033939 RepID=A0ABD5UGG0_9EURY|nr:hypothetical protein [Halomarina sp. PSRA2]
MLVDDGPGRRGAKAALTVGFLALAFAILVARESPASNYELSIYGATPLLTWLGLAVAFVVAVAVAAWGSDADRGWLVPAALGLLVMGMSTIISLPLIRSYHGYGVADALTHLGWARGVASGSQSVLGLVYPGGHAFAATLSAFTGMTVSRSMILIIALTATVYLLFVPLSVRALVGDRMATVIGAFSGAFLLPVTNISTFIDFHPYSLTTFLFPLVLFLLFKYLSDAQRGSALRNMTSATGLLLAVVLLANILFHPQVALNVLIFFATIVAVQRVYRWLPSGAAIGEARSLLAPTLAGFGLFALWILRQPKVFKFLGNLSESVTGFIGIGGGESSGGVGANVAQQGDSITSIGASMPELFAKLFLVHAVFAALAAVLVLVAFSGRLGDRNPERNAAVTYFAYSGLTLTPFFLLQFIGNISGYFFRHFGFGMVIVTILGAITLHAIYTATRGTRSSNVLKTLAVAGVLVALLLSTLVMFPSPYIYKPTHHVSDQMATGHEMTFDHRADEIQYTGIRKGPGRFAEAQEVDIGPTITAPSNERLRAGNLTAYHDEPYYLVVSDYNRQLEMGAYKGLRYNQSGFDGLDDAPGVSRIQSSNGMQVYYVTGSGSNAAPAELNGTGGGDGTFVGETPSPTESEPPSSGNFGGGGGDDGGDAGGANDSGGDGDGLSGGNFGGGGGDDGDAADDTDGGDGDDAGAGGDDGGDATNDTTGGGGGDTDDGGDTNDTDGGGGGGENSSDDDGGFFFG